MPDISKLPPEIWVKVFSMLEYDLKSMESFESTCKFFNQISRDHFCWRRYYSLNYTSSYRDLTAFENILKVENWKRQYRLYENRKKSLAGESENNSNSNSGFESLIELLYHGRYQHCLSDYDVIIPDNNRT